ncbi:hypothetical protein HER39_17350, partial [Arthrobacter deserti]|nr:hypothetical protein [Arthrobacter deserti]
ADMDFLHRVLNNGGPAVPACPATVPAPAPVLSWTPTASFGIEPAMLEALRHAEQALASLGHPVLPLDFDDRGARLVDAHSVIMAYDAVRLRSAEAARRDRISPQLAALFEAGHAIGDAEYAAAHAVVAEELAWLHGELAGGAVLLAPGAQGPAPEGLTATGSPLMCRPWQALGLPVLVVPGLAEPGSGMPLGIQLACLPGREEHLFAVATGLERQLRSAAPSASAVSAAG